MFPIYYTSFLKKTNRLVWQKALLYLLGGFVLHTVSGDEEG